MNELIEAILKRFANSHYHKYTGYEIKAMILEELVKANAVKVPDKR